MTIELYSADAAVGTLELDEPPGPPEATETLTFTWEELGLDGPPNHSEEPVGWVSTWDGAPGLGRLLVDVVWVVGVGDQFVELGQAPRRSVDGVDWVPIELPTDGYVNAIVETADGVAVAMSNGRGPQAFYVGDLVTWEWTPLTGVEPPDDSCSEQPGSGAFLLASYGDERSDRPLDSVGSRQRAEVDGYAYELEVTQTLDEYSVVYTLVDPQPERSSCRRPQTVSRGNEDPFEFVQQDQFGANEITIVDPESGEPLVSIPLEAMTHEVINADGTVTDVSGGAVEYAEPSVPNYW